MADGVNINIGTQGVLVSVPNTVIKAAVAGLALWLASKGINMQGLEGWLQSILGTGVAGGALTSIGLTIHASNQATKAALGAQ